VQRAAAAYDVWMPSQACHLSFPLIRRLWAFAQGLSGAEEEEEEEEEERAHSPTGARALRHSTGSPSVRPRPHATPRGVLHPLPALPPPSPSPSPQTVQRPRSPPTRLASPRRSLADANEVR
jgi:hypothetical protein